MSLENRAESNIVALDARDRIKDHVHIDDVIFELDAKLIKPLSDGYSEDNVYLVESNSSARSLVLKHGNGVGSHEKRGRKLIARHLHVPYLESTGNDHFVQVNVPGTPVDKAVRQGLIINHTSPLQMFAQQFNNLWENTWNDKEPPEGYITKAESTVKEILATKLVDNDSFPVRVGDVANYQMKVNGQSVGTIEGAVTSMLATITENQAGTVVTHGDEGGNNAIVNSVNGLITYIDYGTAGWRRVQEAIAKVLLFYEAHYSENPQYSLAINHKERLLFLKTKSYLPVHIRQALNEARKEMEQWFDSPIEKQILAGFMMMYCFRTIKFAEKRKRAQYIPYILGLAMSFAPAIDGKNYPAPISTYR